MKLTPEERSARVRMAMAEAGYPDSGVSVDPEDSEVGVCQPNAPLSTIWRAFFVADPAGACCWPCFAHNYDGGDLDCTHDARTAPQPEVVR